MSEMKIERFLHYHSGSSDKVWGIISYNDVNIFKFLGHFDIRTAKIVWGTGNLSPITRVFRKTSSEQSSTQTQRERISWLRRFSS